jgi:hypothetical protein
MPREKKKEGKASIIEAVKTPLALCALIVLVIEGILAAISVRLTGWDLRLLLVGMIAALFVIVLAAAYAVRHPEGQAKQLTTPPAPGETKFKYDVFLSVPMAGFSNEEDDFSSRLHGAITLNDKFGDSGSRSAAQIVSAFGQLLTKRHRGTFVMHFLRHEIDEFLCRAALTNSSSLTSSRRHR